MGSLNGSDSCAGSVVVSRGSAAEQHHHHDDAKSSDGTAVAEHDDHDDAGPGPAAEPDDGDDPNYDEVEASSSEDDAADRLYNHNHQFRTAEQFNFKHHNHQFRTAEQFNFKHHDHYDHASADVVAKAARIVVPTLSPIRATGVGTRALPGDKISLFAKGENSHPSKQKLAWDSHGRKQPLHTHCIATTGMKGVLLVSWTHCGIG